MATIGNWKASFFYIFFIFVFSLCLKGSLGVFRGEIATISPQILFETRNNEILLACLAGPVQFQSDWISGWSDDDEHDDDADDGWYDDACSDPVAHHTSEWPLM